jgi:hypothetical protein
MNMMQGIEGSKAGKLSLVHRVAARVDHAYGSWCARQFDARWGVDTAGSIDGVDLDQDLALDLRQSSKGYEGVNELRLRRMFKALQRAAGDLSRLSFFDVGAGKGRAMMLASAWPWRRIGGVELSAELAQVARRNFAHFEKAHGLARPFDFIEGDALSCELPQGPLAVFLYNPFDAAIMAKFVQRVADRVARDENPVWILYCNPEHLDVMLAPGMSRHFRPVQLRHDWALLQAVAGQPH